MYELGSSSEHFAVFRVIIGSLGARMAMSLFVRIAIAYCSVLT